MNDGHNTESAACHLGDRISYVTEKWQTTLVLHDSGWIVCFKENMQVREQKSVSSSSLPAFS